MTERQNIWGKPDCQLPDGKLCNACCILPEIELEGYIVSVAKPANSPCQHLVGSEVAKRGCDLHSGGKPDVCKSWHCSMADLDGKINLISQGIMSNLVSESEACAFALNVLKENNLENLYFINEIRSEITGRAGMLSKITHPRDVVVRDLDET
jgi:hypothetical protein